MFDIPESWLAPLGETVGSGEFAPLETFINAEYAAQTVYPPEEELFAALHETSYKRVRAVILGQDPYHGAGQANGLAFSVHAGVKCPPSLVNIYKALQYDLGIAPTANGDLRGWARQGVLLLNSVLTVRDGQAGSHAGRGWERFTDGVIRALNAATDPIVFLLWGGYARKKAALIDGDRHLILESVHPSPLSFYHGFSECRHFSRANAFLRANGRGEIDWSKRSADEIENCDKV